MKYFAVIGDPIEHSMSPTMHKWIFDSLGMDANYEKIKVGKNELPRINGILVQNNPATR